MAEVVYTGKGTPVIVDGDDERSLNAPVRNSDTTLGATGETLDNAEVVTGGRGEPQRNGVPLAPDLSPLPAGQLGVTGKGLPIPGNELDLAPGATIFDFPTSTVEIDFFDRPIVASAPPPYVPTVTISGANQTVDMTVGTATFNVVLDGATTSTVTVPFTLSGTGVNGVDYTVTASPLVFTPGIVSQTVTWTVIDLAGAQSSRTAIATLGTPQNGTLGTPTSNTLTIRGSWYYNGTTATFVHPATASTTNIYPATKPANGTITVTQPDVPRKLTVTIVSAAANNELATGMLRIVGTGVNGQLVADVFDLNYGTDVTTTLTSDQAFATITEASFSGVTFGSSGGTGSTVAIGGADALGLPVDRPAVTLVNDSFAQKLILPFYFAPGYASDGWSGQAWNQAIATAPAGSIIVFNPAAPYAGAGPGLQAYAVQYIATITAARAAGLKVVGYTYTTYEARTITDVYADIDNYYSWYAACGLDGIFVDEVDLPAPSVGTHAAKLAYLTSLNSYIKTVDPAALNVLNPGAVIDYAGVAISDIIVSFENTAAVFNTYYQPPTWQFTVDPSHNAMALYKGTTSALQTTAIALSKTMNFGYAYVSELDLPGPWSGLPVAANWPAQVAAVNQSWAVTNPDSMPLVTFANDIGYLFVDQKRNYLVRDMNDKYPRVYLDTDGSTATGSLLNDIGANYLIENNIVYKWNGAAWATFGAPGITFLINTFREWKFRISRATYLESITTAIKAIIRSEEYFGGNAYDRYSPTITITSMGVPSGGDAFAVSAITVDGAPVAYTSLDLLAGTVVVAAAPDGSRRFVVTYSIAPNP